MDLDRPIDPEYEEFEQRLREAVREVQDERSVQVYCIVLLFDGASSRELFLTDALPDYRRRFPPLWLPHRTPIEITVD